VLDAEVPALPANELAAALLAIRDSFAESNVDLDALLAADLDPARLEQQIRDSSGTVLKNAALAEGASFVFDRVLTEACNYVTEIALSLPEFEAHAVRE